MKASTFFAVAMTAVLSNASPAPNNAGYGAAPSGPQGFPPQPQQNQGYEGKSVQAPSADPTWGNKPQGYGPQGGFGGSPFPQPGGQYPQQGGQYPPQYPQGPQYSPFNGGRNSYPPPPSGFAGGYPGGPSGFPGQPPFGPGGFPGQPPFGPGGFPGGPGGPGGFPGFPGGPGFPGFPQGPPPFNPGEFPPFNPGEFPPFNPGEFPPFNPGEFPPLVPEPEGCGNGGVKSCCNNEGGPPTPGGVLPVGILGGILGPLLGGNCALSSLFDGSCSTHCCQTVQNNNGPSLINIGQVCDVL